MNGGGLRARDLTGFRNDTSAGELLCDGGGGGWCLFSLSLLPGPMIWLYGFSWDEKAEMCRLCIEQKFPFCAELFELSAPCGISMSV
jgi:hypothetical protein